MPGSQKGDQPCFLRRCPLLWVPLRFGQLLLLTNVRGIWTAAWGRMYTLFVMSTASKSLSFLHLQGSQDGAHLDQWTWDLWKGKNGISNLLVSKISPTKVQMNNPLCWRLYSLCPGNSRDTFAVLLPMLFCQWCWWEPPQKCCWQPAVSPYEARGHLHR